MYTSFYRNRGILNQNNRLVSISRTISPWVGTIIPANKLTHYPTLAPSWALLSDYKQGACTVDEYTQRFNDYLYSLDAQRIYDDLNDDCILLCYETPTQFCHRHLVANWLNECLKLNITEFDHTILTNISDGFEF